MANRFWNLIFTLLLMLSPMEIGSCNAVQTHSVFTAASTSHNMNNLRRNSYANQQYSTQIAKQYTTSTIDNIPKTNPQFQRKTKDVEDILNGMAHKDPYEWEATEWIVFALFISLFGWIACCLCSMCCCKSNNLLGWLCFWEICCRDGRDLDACCDAYNRC